MGEYTKKLEELKIDDLWSLYAGIYLLQVQAQALIDIVMRGCAELGLKAEGYTEAGRKLAEIGVMSNEDFEFYRRVVGFRNTVVHAYARVNFDLVRKIIEGREFEKVYLLALKVVEELKKRGVDP